MRIHVDATDAIRELERDGFIIISPNDISNDGIGEAIKILEQKGCPKDIINQIKEWQNAPICDAFKLRQWCECVVRK